MDKKNVFSGSPNQNRAVIEHGKITIMNNALYYKDSVLQLANISRAWIGDFEPKPLPKWVLILTAIGVIFFLIGMAGVTSVLAFGLILGGFGAFIIYSHQKNNQPKFGIQIEMNSSFVAIFSSTDRSFLEKILQSIADDFCGRFEGRVEYNIEDNSIHVENNSGVVSTGKNARVTNSVASNHVGKEHEHNSNQ